MYTKRLFLAWVMYHFAPCGKGSLPFFVLFCFFHNYYYCACWTKHVISKIQNFTLTSEEGLPNLLWLNLNIVMTNANNCMWHTSVIMAENLEVTEWLVQMCAVWSIYLLLKFVCMFKIWLTSEIRRFRMDLDTCTCIPCLIVLLVL